LLDEKIMRAIYEDQHSDNYDAAIRLASSKQRGATKAFPKLLQAAEAAYLVDTFGLHVMRPPRIHFLHRGFLDIAELLGVDDLTNRGLEEFFEDLCPCKKKHNAEAIRKLRKRKAGVSSARPRS
jgi:hypothetical protein